jgi:hypothetical protein
MRRLCTGCFHTLVNTFWPCHETSRGRPTFTDNSRAIDQPVNSRLLQQLPDPDHACTAGSERKRNGRPTSRVTPIGTLFPIVPILCGRTNAAAHRPGPVCSGQDPSAVPWSAARELCRSRTIKSSPPLCRCSGESMSRNRAPPPRVPHILRRHHQSKPANLTLGLRIGRLNCRSVIRKDDAVLRQSIWLVGKRLPHRRFRLDFQWDQRGIKDAQPSGRAASAPNFALSNEWVFADDSV